jgi:hypothetical protein
VTFTEKKEKNILSINSTPLKKDSTERNKKD